MGIRDLEIARAVKLRPIQEIADTIGLGLDDLELYGRFKAKVRWEAIARAAANPDGRLVLVTAMTPTPAGEGKSTTTVGLADGLRKLGRRSIVALREPSLGPVFGVRTSTCTSPATCTPSAPPTTCCRRCSTTI